MRIYNNERGAGLQHAVGLGERSPHHVLIEPPGLWLATVVAVRCNNCFAAFWGELAREVIGKQAPYRSLKPDVEEIGQVGVGDIVVVRRICDDGVDGPVRDRKICSGAAVGTTGPGYGRQRPEERSGVLDVTKRVADRTPERIDLREIPDHGQRLALVSMSEKLTLWNPRRETRRVIHHSSQGHRKS